VADERGHVGDQAAPLERRQILRIRLEIPLDAGPHRLQRHALDVGEVAHHEVAMSRPARGDREAAVADHERGDAEAGRRRGVRVPRQLRIVVGVQIHDARGQHEPLGVDPLARRAQIGAASIIADRGDAAVPDCQAAVPGRCAETIDEAGVDDDEIVHGSDLLTFGVFLTA
jgi:hypothetical protein